MSRFNEKSYGVKKVVNLAGGEAFKESRKLEAASLVLTSFMSDQYYRTVGDAVYSVVSLVRSDPKFMAKAAVLARQEFGMRSITHVIAAEVAACCKGERWTRPFFYKVVRRVDDMTEIVALYLSMYGKPLPNSLKDGLAKAFNKFNSYHLAKYRAEKKKVSLVDVVNLVHPVPTEENKDALKALVDGTLRSDDTWESMMTKVGQEAADEETLEQGKSEVWAKLIEERKIGYFALLRNLRNIIVQSPESIDSACQMLIDPKLIRGSLVMPFRYTTAIEAIEEMSPNLKQSRVISFIEAAMEISLENVPELPGSTLIAVDCSGSMSGRVGKIASLFAAVLSKRNKEADVMIFDDDARYVFCSPEIGLYQTYRNIHRYHNSFGGTNFNSVFKRAERPYDNIVILSDMQSWMDYYSPVEPFNKYKERHNAAPIMFSFDLAGYGTLAFPEKSVYCLAGFHEKVFEIMALLRDDKNALVKAVEQVEL